VSAVEKDRRSALERLCRQYDVVIMYAFGSRGREVWEWLSGQRARLEPGSSDVDIGVKMRPGHRLSPRQKATLALELEDLLGVSQVDLVVVDEARPFLASAIVQGERLYAEDSYLADEYDLYVLRRAGDLLPLAREREALVLGEDIDHGSGTH